MEHGEHLKEHNFQKGFFTMMIVFLLWGSSSYSLSFHFPLFQKRNINT